MRRLLSVPLLAPHSAWPAAPCLGLILKGDPTLEREVGLSSYPSTKAYILMGEADSSQPWACLQAQGGGCGSPAFIDLC